MGSVGLSRGQRREHALHVLSTRMVILRVGPSGRGSWGISDGEVRKLLGQRSYALESPALEAAVC